MNNIPLLMNEQGDTLLYYNTISTAKIVFLSLRYVIPMGGLHYLIKFNPFYMTYPVMLPIMVLSYVYYIFALLNFLRSLQKIVDEIWLDKTGSEIRVVYRNRSYRKFRGVTGEEIIMNSSLVSPSEHNLLSI